MGVDTVFYSSISINECDVDIESFQKHMNSEEAKELEKEYYPNDWKVDISQGFMMLSPDSKSHRGSVSDGFLWLAFIMKYVTDKSDAEQPIISGQILYQTAWGDMISGILTPQFDGNMNLILINTVVQDDGSTDQEQHQITMDKKNTWE